MRYKLFLMSLTFSAQSSFAAPIDCAQDLNCFIKAAESCVQANLLIEESGDKKEFYYKVQRQMIIQGLINQKCVYQDLIKNAQITLPQMALEEFKKKGWTEDLINGQVNYLARSYDLILGLSRECAFSTDELVTHLQDNFVQKKQTMEKWKNCKKEIIARDKQNEITNPTEKTNEDKELALEVNQNPHFNIMIPKYLEYPFEFVLPIYIDEMISTIFNIEEKDILEFITDSDDSSALSPQEDSEEISSNSIPSLSFINSTDSDQITPKPQGTPSSFFSQSKNKIPFAQMNQAERLQLITKGPPPPTRKIRLSALMTHQELVDNGLTNDQIGEYAFNQIKQNKDSYNKAKTCVSDAGCEGKTRCDPYLKRCLECHSPGDCPDDQICHHYKCVPGNTLIRPEFGAPTN